MKKQPLEPLIPLDQLRKVVAGLVAVPKPEIEKPKRRKRAQKRT